jgi:hypothetical protein
MQALQWHNIPGCRVGRMPRSSTGVLLDDGDATLSVVQRAGATRERLENDGMVD